MKLTEVRYPKFIDPCAMIIGKFRDVISTEMNEDNPKYKRGPQTEFVNILGLKGELIVQYYCHINDIKYESAYLLSARPYAGPDLKIGNKTFDVKTVRPDATEWLVTVESQNKPSKKVDYYIFVQIVEPGVALCGRETWEEVGKWPAGQKAYTYSHYQPITHEEVTNANIMD